VRGSVDFDINKILNSVDQKVNREAQGPFIEPQPPAKKWDPVLAQLRRLLADLLSATG
jgi:hypothetical protein